MLRKTLYQKCHNHSLNIEEITNVNRNVFRNINHFVNKLIFAII